MKPIPSILFFCFGSERALSGPVGPFWALWALSGTESLEQKGADQDLEGIGFISPEDLGLTLKYIPGKTHERWPNSRHLMTPSVMPHLR